MSVVMQTQPDFWPDWMRPIPTRAVDAEWLRRRIGDRQVDFGIERGFLVPVMDV